MARTILSPIVALLVLVLVLVAFGLFGVRVIVIQPIGALPDGATVIASGLNTNWLDSPDAICQREMGGVSLFCRALQLEPSARERS
ncbi:MAG TPA: hypothetical protein VH184_13155 [Dongiaceae bacterium]|jgi:hypothetical protein|nr:hypothetical protein [Dongiaceae bacterium]